MEPLTSKEAAEQAGVNVRRWHYLASLLDLTPARQLPGVRGAKLWRRSDVNKVRQLNERQAAA